MTMMSWLVDRPDPMSSGTAGYLPARKTFRRILPLRDKMRWGRAENGTSFENRHRCAQAEQREAHNANRLDRFRKASRQESAQEEGEAEQQCAGGNSSAAIDNRATETRRR